VRISSAGKVVKVSISEMFIRTSRRRRAAGSSTCVKVHQNIEEEKSQRLFEFRWVRQNQEDERKRRFFEVRLSSSLLVREVLMQEATHQSLEVNHRHSTVRIVARRMIKVH
jgi:hypothetical protein